jgi:hypothetical protein
MTQVRQWFRRRWVQGSYRHALCMLHRRCLIERYGLSDCPGDFERYVARIPLDVYIAQVEHYAMQLRRDEVPVPEDCTALAANIQELMYAIKR